MIFVIKAAKNALSSVCPLGVIKLTAILSYSILTDCDFFLNGDFLSCDKISQ